MKVRVKYFMQCSRDTDMNYKTFDNDTDFVSWLILNHFIIDIRGIEKVN